jgi:hypothetical protein
MLSLLSRNNSFINILVITINPAVTYSLTHPPRLILLYSFTILALFGVLIPALLTSLRNEDLPAGASPLALLRLAAVDQPVVERLMAALIGASEEAVRDSEACPVTPGRVEAEASRSAVLGLRLVGDRGVLEERLVTARPVGEDGGYGLNTQGQNEKDNKDE